MPPRSKTKAEAGVEALFEVSLASLGSKKTDIVPHLEKLYQRTTELEQDVHKAPNGFEAIAKELLLPKYTENTDKEIRLLVGCCLTEVLRVYVPEAPYEDDDMIRLFHLLISLIRGLETQDATTVLGVKMVKILDGLATVKSCVVPVLLTQRGVGGADEILRFMFETCVAILRPDHPHQVLEKSLEILVACIEEFEGVTEDLLDILMLPLLPTAKVENAVAYKVVGTALRTCVHFVKETVSKITNDMLISSDGAEHNHSLEISEELYPLIYELHKISPELLSDIIPTLSMQLKVEDNQVRSKATALLAKLYVSKSFDFSAAFPKDFRDFLGRLNDLSPYIRTEVMEVCGALLKDRPVLFSAMEDGLTRRLRDSEEDVRLKALSVLFSFGGEHIKELSVDTINAIAERAVDKKFEVRRAVLIGLSKLFSRHIAARSAPLNSTRVSDGDALLITVDCSVIDRLRMVPSIVIKCWGYPDHATKHLVVQLLQEHILYCLKPVKAAQSTDSEASSENDNARVKDSSAMRATMLLSVYWNLDDVDKKALVAILAFKRRVNQELQNFLLFRAAEASTNRAPSAEALVKTEESLKKLTHLIPFHDKKAGAFDRVVSNKDKFVYRLLDSCISTSDSIEEAVVHRDDLIRRLDSKSLLAEYFHIVYDFAGPLMCNSAMVEHLLTALTTLGVHGFSPVIADLLCALAQVQPKLFHQSGRQFLAWLDLCVASGSQGKQPQLRAQLLDKFIAVAKHVAQCPSSDFPKLEVAQQLLVHLRSASSRAHSTRLAELLTHLAALATEESVRNEIHDACSKFVKEVCKRDSLQANSSRVEVIMAILASLFTIPGFAYGNFECGLAAAKTVMQLLTPVRGAIVQFVLHDIIAKDAAAVSLKLEAMTLFTAIVCAEEESKQFFEVGEQKGKFPPNAAVQPRVSLNPQMGSPEYSSLVTLLFDILTAEGQTLNGVDVGKAKGRVYERAALCTVALLKTKKFEDSITVSQWQQLAWAFIANDVDTRQHLLESLSEVMQFHQVHPRFLCYPCLLSNDTALAEGAQQALLSAVRRLRKTHEDITSKRVTTDDMRLRDRYTKMAAITMPEFVLPYLLYLLSYHPNCPESVKIRTEEDKKAMKVLVRCIQTLIQALQATLRKESDNLPFLFKQLNKLSQRCADRFDADNIGLQFVTGLATKLLQDQIKTQDNAQTFPGHVEIPSELYVETTEGQAALVRTVGQVTGAADAVEETATAIRQAVQVGKSKAKSAAFSSPSRSFEQHSPGKKKAKKESLSTLVEDDGDEEGSIRKQQGKSHKASGRSSKGSKATPEQEAPSRALPRRGAKAVVNYADPDESDQEVERWNEEAGRQHRRSSSASGGGRHSSSLIRGQHPEESPLPSPSLKSAKNDEIDLFQTMDTSGLDTSVYTQSKRRKETSLEKSLREESHSAFELMMKNDSAEADHSDDIGLNRQRSSVGAGRISSDLDDSMQSRRKRALRELSSVEGREDTVPRKGRASESSDVQPAGRASRRLAKV